MANGSSGTARDGVVSLVVAEGLEVELPLAGAHTVPFLINPDYPAYVHSWCIGSLCAKQ
jgi:hypothetical protein